MSASFPYILALAFLVINGIAWIELTARKDAERDEAARAAHAVAYRAFTIASYSRRAVALEAEAELRASQNCHIIAAGLRGQAATLRTRIASLQA